ncbi:MAG TPA: universal stress protein [Pedococcus sp.]|jgi:nucleotide-binding universal stress UspA family protein|uniref:universal stress protein n=1 Tax=Pedococcus sp. TaxID=2860345 RepID=UPI002F94896E
MAASDRGALVVGVDGSPGGEAALEWATDEARRRHLPLRLVHATNVDYLVAAAMLSPTDVTDVPDELVEEARARVQAAAPDVDVTAEASTQSAARALVERSVGAEEVVVGSHGKGPVRGALGSVSLQVAMHARCPVVVVRGHEPGMAAGPVVVGVDGSALSSEAVGYAFEQASLRGVPLAVVYAWWIEFVEGVVVTTPGTPHWGEIRERQRLAVSESLAGWREKYPDVEVEVHIEHGRPTDAIVANSERACLVVVGARGRGGFGGLLLGSVSHGVLHRAHCPVAVVRSR